MSLQRMPLAGWFGGLILLAMGCGSALHEQSNLTQELIEKASRNGAQRCAPVELALAQSHRDFAKQEIEEGNYYNAREELEVAEENARKALAKSPIGLCTKLPVKAPTDRDGDGIFDKEDRCPDKPEDKDDYEDEDGCPEVDNDQDGIVDVDDKCPNEPEDKDDYEDEDGCPDKDNDQDGLADSIDKCPNEAEDVDGFEDDDGCPDCDNDGDGVPECPEAVDQCPDKPAKTASGCPEFKNIVVTKEKIELKQTVYFETAKAVIRSRSYGLLNEVAQALKDRPKIRVRIEGHTDSRGRDSYNLRLSQKRAESVRQYLTAQGVSSERMLAQGYGETQPISDNRTRAGRSQNRRVEFVIIEQ